MKELSKSYKMLEAIIYGGSMSIEEMADFLDTSEKCVRLYINMFRNGKKNHHVIAMRVSHGLIMIEQHDVEWAIEALKSRR